MQTRIGKKINARTQAMWLIAHLRAMGIEPIPFGHDSYSSYRAELQRHHDPARASLDKKSASLARTAARAAVRAKTLEGVAGDLLPATENVIANVVVAGRTALDQVNRDLETASHNPPGDEQRTFTPKEAAVCRRKLRHTNFLSALIHLVRVGDLGMHAYPCTACLGIHIGHDRDRVRLQKIVQQLKEVNLSITKLMRERTQLEEQHTVLFQMQQRLICDADTSTLFPEKY